MLRIVVKVSLLRLLLCYCFFWLCSLNTEINTLRRLQKSQSQKSSFRGVPLPGLNRWDLFKKLEEMDVTPISLTDSFCQKLNVKWLLFISQRNVGTSSRPPYCVHCKKRGNFGKWVSMLWQWWEVKTLIWKYFLFLLKRDRSISKHWHIDGIQKSLGKQSSQVL